MLIVLNIFIKVIFFINIMKRDICAFDLSYLMALRKWPVISQPLLYMQNQQTIPYRCLFYNILWTNCFVSARDVAPIYYQNTETTMKKHENQRLNRLLHPSDHNFNLTLGKLEPQIPVFDIRSFAITPVETIHLDIPYDGKTSLEINKMLVSSATYNRSIASHNESIIKPANDSFVLVPNSKTLMQSSMKLHLNNTKSLDILLYDFKTALEKLERQFYMVTFLKLTSSCPEDRRENGISFIQSGLFLQLLLMAISTEVDMKTKAEIDNWTGLNISDVDKIELIKAVVSTMPTANMDMAFRWSSRLVLGPGQNVSEQFTKGAASSLGLHLVWFNASETAETLTQKLNRMVEEDSKGAMQDTFEEEEFAYGLRALAMNTLYLRAHWRSAPTVLNGSRPFRDSNLTPRKTVRMIRINDVMRYGDLTECNSEAIEISYATPGLTLLILVPRGGSLRNLVGHVAASTLHNITEKMITMRVAASLPLYTLRMTLLLPSKLQTMGISRIFEVNTTTTEQLRLSHGLQRIMFWAEAGRNAFKDDGIEWDETPDYEMVVDRPYIFFVRWKNMTLLNGNFVL